ncbi:MAG: hypothetical protein ABWZ76_08185 [Acidimicrobiales bacterium]
MTVGTLLVMGSPASAHVHGFTPLGCLTTDNANAGAIVGFEQASDSAAPLNGPTGLIPLNASGKRPTGGQGAEHACG